MIDTCKPAMDVENAAVLRMYEYMGSAVGAVLYLPKEVNKVTICNMLEEKQAELQLQKDGERQYVEMQFGAFEIKTLLLEA